MSPFPYQPLPHGDPGPVMDATFRSNGNRRTIPAFVDTGADVTQVPEDLAQQLDLQPIGETTLIGPSDDETPATVYVANLDLGPLTFEFIEVVGGPTDDVLIGRNVLAQVVATFHGPGQHFDLVRP